MSSTEDIKYIEVFGSDFFKDKFFRPKEKVISYNKYNIAIGKKLNGQTYYLDTKEVLRCCVVGANASGKTFLIREMCDRLYLSGRLICYLTDIKNEFWSSRKPVQEKFRHLLLEHEKPRAFKIATLRGTFFKQIDKNLAHKNYWYSMNMNNIEKGDFFTLMRVDEMTQNQQTFMDILYEEIEKRLKNKEDFSFELINECIDGLEEFKDSTKISMKNKFRPLKNSFLFEKEHELDIVELLNNGIIPSLNYESFDSFPKSGLRYDDLFLSMNLRQIIKARRQNRIKPIFIIMDEALRYIGITKNTNFKDDVRESIELDRAYAVNYIFAVQDLDAFEERMLKNCRYIMIPRTADVGTIQKALVNMSMTKNTQSSTNDAMKIKQRLREHRYAWVIMDRFGNGKYDIILPLAPLSNHLESRL